jgi:hypothetical protein
MKRRIGSIACYESVTSTVGVGSWKLKNWQVNVNEVISGSGRPEMAEPGADEKPKPTVVPVR